MALLAQIFIGWPAIIGSLLISLLGLHQKRAGYLVIGSLLSVGFAWYLTGSPNVFLNLLGISLPLAHLLALLSLRQKKNWGYFLVILPYILVFSRFC